MKEYEKLLALCRTCVNSLNSAMDMDLPSSLKMQLRQKIFILEAAIADFSIKDNEYADSELHESEPIPSDLKEASRNFERKIIVRAIETYGSKRKAAKALGLDHSTLIKKCQRYEI